MIFNLLTHKMNRFEISVKQTIMVTKWAGIQKREIWSFTCDKYHYLDGYSYTL